MYQKYKREMEANGVEVGKSLSEMKQAPPRWDLVGNLEGLPRVSPAVSLALGLSPGDSQLGLDALLPYAPGLRARERQELPHRLPAGRVG